MMTAQSNPLVRFLSHALKGAGLASLILFIGAAKVPAKKAATSAKPAITTALRIFPPAAIDTELLRPAKLTAYANRPASIEQRRTLRMEVTAYCPCKKCCGPEAQGITASGETIAYNGGKFVAADTDMLPFGTRLVIPGYDVKEVEVIDRGGAIKGRKLDVFFPTHDQALEWGRRWVDVTIVE